MTAPRSSVEPPAQASPSRRVLHTLIALAGWVLFVYWWWLVFRRVSRNEIRFTALFIVISLAAVVLITAAWAYHNLQVFRRKGPRTHVREVEPDFSRDGVGHGVAFTAPGDMLRSAPVIHVRMVDQDKMYVATRRLAAPSAAPGGVAGPGPSPGGPPDPRRR